MFDTIQGNEENKKYFAEKISAHSLSHAYIIAGGEECEKKEFALSVCAALACETGGMPCGECISCKKILADECVDIYTVKKPDGRVYIPVDSIRAIYDTVFLKPNDLEFKAYIITNAEKMLPASQNALLKLLEEPPANVYFFILISDSSLLLPTIISRSVKITMQSQSTATAESNKAEVQKAKKDAKKLLTILSNSNNKFEFINTHHQLFSKAEEFYFAYEMLLCALRDIALYKSDCESNPIFFESNKTAEEYADFFSLSALVDMCAVITKALNNQKTPTRLSLTISEYSQIIWEKRH